MFGCWVFRYNFIMFLGWKKKKNIDNSLPSQMHLINSLRNKCRQMMQYMCVDAYDSFYEQTFIFWISMPFSISKWVTDLLKSIFGLLNCIHQFLKVFISDFTILKLSHSNLLYVVKRCSVRSEWCFVLFVSGIRQAVCCFQRDVVIYCPNERYKDCLFSFTMIK